MKLFPPNFCGERGRVFLPILIAVSNLSIMMPVSRHPVGHRTEEGAL